MSTPIRVDTDERLELLTQLANQRDLLRMSAYGLRHEQVTATPTVGDLSLAGVIKRAARMEQRWIAGSLRPGSPWPDHDERPQRGSGFGLDPGETLADVIGLYAAVAEQTELALATVTRLEQRVPSPPRMSPFLAGKRSWSVRSVLLHVIETTADHVRAADIVRNILERSGIVSMASAVSQHPSSHPSASQAT